MANACVRGVRARRALSVAAVAVAVLAAVVLPPRGALAQPQTLPTEGDMRVPRIMHTFFMNGEEVCLRAVLFAWLGAIGRFCTQPRKQKQPSSKTPPTPQNTTPTTGPRRAGPAPRHRVAARVARQLPRAPPSLALHDVGRARRARARGARLSGPPADI
jgi:hypothetical protein